MKDMKGIFKNEMKRAFINRNMFIAVFIGCVIAVMQVIKCSIPAIESLKLYELYGKAEYPDSLFNTWIGGVGYTYHAVLYTILIPLIAIFPYAGSLYQDIKSGYVKIIFTKVSKKKYFVSKIIAAFLSGGTAVVIPLILNLFLTALFVPALRPDASTMMFSINDGSMFSDIYYSKPFVYILLYMLLIFMMAGVFCVMCLAVSFLVDNYFVVLTSVFIYYIVENYICLYFWKTIYSFEQFFRIDQPVAGISIGFVLGKCMLFFIVSLEMLVVEAKREEIY